MSGVPTNLRVLNLFFDLLTSEHGRTKNQVRASSGYSSMGHAAFESAFQRDKDALREAGIVLELVGEPGTERYRVDPASFPSDDRELTPTDLALVDLAVSAWSSVPAAHTQMLRTKLAALAPEDAGGGLVPVMVGLDGAQRVVDILNAIRDRRVISFTYAASSGTGQRAVEPWRLVLRGGGLYLHGWDLDRDAPRVFRLSRFRGDVEILGEPGDAPAPAEDPADPFEALVVAPVLRVRPGAGAHVRLYATAPADVAEPTRTREFPSHAVGSAPRVDEDDDGPTDWDRLDGRPDEVGEWISRILADAQDVVVVAPKELRRSILERLEAAALWPRPSGVHHA